MLVILNIFYLHMYMFIGLLEFVRACWEVGWTDFTGVREKTAGERFFLYINCVYDEFKSFFIGFNLHSRMYSVYVCVHTT